MKILLILNDPPYGTERSYNGLRLAKALAGKGAEVDVFLMADAVACAKAGQKVPPGYYNLELMVKSVARRGEVLLCCAAPTSDVVVEAREARSPADIAQQAVGCRLRRVDRLGTAVVTTVRTPRSCVLRFLARLTGEEHAASQASESSAA